MDILFRYIHEDSAQLRFKNQEEFNFFQASKSCLISNQRNVKQSHEILIFIHNINKEFKI